MAAGLAVPPKAMLEHFDVKVPRSLCAPIAHNWLKVNVNGSLVLFQTVYPLLKASTPSPKFMAISSIAGSITIAPGFPFKSIAYGASKAALNFVVRKLHSENDGLGECFARICMDLLVLTQSARSRVHRLPRHCYHRHE
jgi:NAD(P)-dependent dehydrogenase (short-subunit alcohol dehydrogenase family)